MPTLVVTAADGSKVVLNEGAATLQYIADHGEAKNTGLIFPVGDIRRYQLINHLNFCSSELHPGVGTFFGKPEGAAREAALARVHTKLALLETHALKEQGFLGGADKPTVADLYTYIVLLWLPYLLPDVQAKLHETHPKIAAFIARVAAIEGVKAAHAEMAAAPHGECRAARAGVLRAGGSPTARGARAGEPRGASRSLGTVIDAGGRFSPRPPPFVASPPRARSPPGAGLTLHHHPLPARSLLSAA